MSRDWLHEAQQKPATYALMGMMAAMLMVSSMASLRVFVAATCVVAFPGYLLLRYHRTRIDYRELDEEPPSFHRSLLVNVMEGHPPREVFSAFYLNCLNHLLVALFGLLFFTSTIASVAFMVVSWPAGLAASQLMALCVERVFGDSD